MKSTERHPVVRGVRAVLVTDRKNMGTVNQLELNIAHGAAMAIGAEYTAGEVIGAKRLLRLDDGVFALFVNLVVDVIVRYFVRVFAKFAEQFGLGRDSAAIVQGFEKLDVGGRKIGAERDSGFPLLVHIGRKAGEASLPERILGDLHRRRAA